MNTKFEPQRHLIIALDFMPGETDTYGDFWLKGQVDRFAEKLAGSGVCLKLNSAARALDYGFIRQLKDRRFDIFVDFKLNDIPETLATDGMLLDCIKPKFVTAMCSTGIDALKALKEKLPDTKVLGVTVLTKFTNSECESIYGCNVKDGVLRFAQVAVDAGIDGVICAPTDLVDLKKRFGRKLEYVTPGIRPEWAVVQGDDQNPDRVMTPAKAIAAGANYIVVGRPILRHPNPLEAVKLTVDEIAMATEEE